MQSYHSNEEIDTDLGGDSDWLEGSEDDQVEEMKVAGKGGEGQRSTTSMAERETEKVQRKMYDDGYREGIGLGKENAIQQAFDTGFKTNGAPIGRRLGQLKGTLHALEIRLIQIQDSSPELSSHQGFDAILKSTQSLRLHLHSLQLKDLIEPDWEAIEHERLHGGQVDNLQRETKEEKRNRERILIELEVQVNKLVKDASDVM